MPPIPAEFRISDFGFSAPTLHPSPGAPSRRGAVVEGLVARAACGRAPGIFPVWGTWLFSLRRALPAPSMHHNQPRKPSITPIPRKVAVGEAQRGFPRAGGRGVGAGKIEDEGGGPPECSPPARQRRAALEDGGTDERLRSEGTLSENAWPRAKTADGGRAWRRLVSR